MINLSAPAPQDHGSSRSGSDSFEFSRPRTKVTKGDQTPLHLDALQGLPQGECLLMSPRSLYFGPGAAVVSRCLGGGAVKVASG